MLAFIFREEDRAAPGSAKGAAARDFAGAGEERFGLLAAIQQPSNNWDNGRMAGGRALLDRI